MNNTDEIIVVVDGQDNIVRHVPRSEMRFQGLLHRVTYLLVFNHCGQLLVQTRTMEKDWYPGYLDLAAGGVVQAGESYDLSAKRELKEELGISAALKPCFKIYFEEQIQHKHTRSWGLVYTCCSEGPFVLQKEEVAAAQFMEVDQVLNLDPDTVTPDTRQALIAYLL